MSNTQIWRNYIEHISVSQVRDWCRNPRRWLMSRVLKLPTTYSPATEIGGIVHKAIEEFLYGMPNTCEHDLAKHCLKALIKSDRFLDQIENAELEIERKIWHNYDHRYPPLLGFIDVYIPNYFKGCPAIMDHKTSKTRKYFKSARDLKFDKQLIVYAHWALTQCPNATGVFVQHNQLAYSNKRDVLSITATFICRRRIEIEFGKLKGIIDMMMRSLEKYATEGLPDTARCQQCNNSFGPNSCEFSGICKGMIDEDGYRATYESLQDDDGNVSSWDLQQAVRDLSCPFKNLTINSEPDIIKVQGDKDMKLIVVSDLVGMARDQTKKITNTWDRREAITKAIVSHIKEKAESDEIVVVVPSHFIGGSIDPDYMPIVTQLKELGIKVHLEV